MKKTTLLNFYFAHVCLFLFCCGISRGQTNNSAPFCQGSFSTSPCNQPAFSNFPSNTVNDFIDNFVTTGATTNIVNANSGCNGLANNYIYYCTPYMVVIPDQVITCSVQSGITFAQSFALFIDWNQNNNFEIPAERVAATFSSPPAASWYVMTFTVPSSQPNGQYRLRLRCHYAGIGNYVDPCNSAYVGETEDYNLYVGNSGPAPLSALINHNIPLCTGQNLNFQINHSGSSSTIFNWQGPGGFNTIVQNPIISALTTSASGIYTVDVVDGPCSITKTISINVTATPTLSVNSATVCAGNLAVLTASGANTYAWNSGQTISSISITPVATTTFVVTGTTNSCTSSQTTTIMVVPVLSMSVNTSNSLICTGNSATVSASGASNYTWSTGANSNSVILSPTVTTTYTVSGANGPCTDKVVYIQYVEECNTGLGLEEYKTNYFRVYPNPVTNQLTVSGATASEIALFNSLGQQVHLALLAESHTIDTSSLPDGIYYLFIHSGNLVKREKIVKN